MTNSKKPGNKTQVKKSEIAKIVWNFDPVSPWFPNLNVFMYVKRKKKKMGWRVHVHACMKSGGCMRTFLFPGWILAEIQKEDTRLCTSCCRERWNVWYALHQLVSEMRTGMWYMTTLHIKCCFLLSLCLLNFLRLNIKVRQRKKWHVKLLEFHGLNVTKVII